MKLSEILRLLSPVIVVIIGVVLKTSNKEQFLPFRKYWLFFIIGGSLMFLHRMYKLL
jgi:hypothetical protein